MSKSNTPAATTAAASTRQQLAAFRAHRTMAEKKLKGTRGKARATIKEQIAFYDDLIAMAA